MGKEYNESTKVFQLGHSLQKKQKLLCLSFSISQVRWKRRCCAAGVEPLRQGEKSSWC